MKPKREIKPEERPICSCGHPMKLVHSVGYYEEYTYWACVNDDCSLDLDDLEPDYGGKGLYV